MKARKREFVAAASNLVMAGDGARSLPIYAKSVFGEYILKYHSESFSISPSGHIVEIVKQNDGEYNTEASTTFDPNVRN